MNNEIQAKMRKDLMDSKKGFGMAVGGILLFTLVTGSSAIPGIDTLIKTERWPVLVMLTISVLAGWIAGTLRTDAVRAKINGYDDDTLQYEHGEMKRKKLISDVLFFIVVALVVAYFLFRR